MRRGERTALSPRFANGELTDDVSGPNALIRLSFAKTRSGAQEMAGVSSAALLDLTDGWQDADVAPSMRTAANLADLAMVPMDEDAAASAEDAPEPQDGGSGDAGGLLLAVMPLLVLLAGF